MRILVKIFFLLLTANLFVAKTSAQKTPAKKPVVINTPKFKPPKLYTYLGAYKDSATVPLATVLSILGTPLKIYDDKKVAYTVSSYQFLYKKRTVTEEETDGQVNGKISPSTSVYSQRFTSTPLPNLWIEKILEQLKEREELYFFDVIAKDAQGRVMYAGNLKIITQ